VCKIEDNVEKLIYTEEDFEDMDWHDVYIHGMGFDSKNFELFLDVDYIFKWIKKPRAKYYSFIIAPATVVFRNVWDYTCDFISNINLTIMSIDRINPRVPNNHEYIKDKTEWRWEIELLEGEIKFNSTGYKLYTRQQPEIKRQQHYTLQERNGISFEKVELNLKSILKTL